MALNLARARDCALAARCAYAGVQGSQPRVLPDQDARFGELRMEEWSSFGGSRMDLQGYVARRAEELLVVFRGSASLLNWVANVAFEWCPASVGPGRVHRGFSEAWTEVAEEVLAQVSRWNGELRRPVWVVGHSLGGAVAVLAACKLRQAGHAVTVIETFGAPRVGDAAFAAAFDFPAERWVNAQDPVPLVPLGGPFATGYCHVGTLRYLSASGTLSEQATMWERLREQAAGLFTVEGPNWQAKASAYIQARLCDHDINAYLTKLERLATGPSPQR